MISFRNLGRLGRFGNQLFQYAAARLYAEINGFPFTVPSWVGDRLFTLPTDRPPLLSFQRTVQLDDLHTRSIADRLRAPLGLWKRARMADLWQGPTDGIDLYGYLQDEATLNMLRGHRDIIRGWFTFRPEIESAFRAATDASLPWTGVHVRRGDLLTGNRRIVGLDAYRAILAQSDGRTVYIASDDRTIGSELAAGVMHVVNPLPEIQAYAPDDIFDFWMLKESVTIIAGGSTFAWWAAFLGTGDYWAPPLSHLWPPDYAPLLEHRTP